MTARLLAEVRAGPSGSRWRSFGPGEPVESSQLRSLCSPSWRSRASRLCRDLLAPCQPRDLLAIGLSAIPFTAVTAFPGWLALLPTLRAVAVVAGNPPSRWSPTRLMNFRPVQLLGDISYSLYLWLWLLIVLVPIVVGCRLTTLAKVLIFAGSLVLALANKRVIEDRLRVGGVLGRPRPRRVFATAVV